MALFEDLSPCDYFGAEFAGSVAAVGWLQADRPFPTGRVDLAVYQRLVELLKEPWQPGVFMGMHECDLCLYAGVTGSHNLFVPGDGCVFVCPELIVHFMNAHSYRPPAAFCRAVLACPPMRSMAYFKALTTAGGEALVRKSREVRMDTE